MKINFLLGDYIYSKNKTGVQLYYENIIKKMIISGKYDVVVSAFDSSANISSYGLPCFAKNTKYSHKIFKILKYFIPIDLLFPKSDIYISDGFVPYTCYGGKKIAIIHDLMFLIYPENYSLKHKLILKLYYHQLKRADHIIAVSQTTKNDLIRLLSISPSKISVVYNGLDPIRNEYTDTSTSALSSNNIDLSKKYCFYIGDFRKNKNINILLHSFKRIMELDGDAYLYLAGSKKGEYNSLKKYCDSNNMNMRVKFIGYVNEYEKHLLYTHAFVFMYISAYEGFGVPIIEAMQYGVPVITSNTSSMKEIANKAAYLVDPNSIEDIVEAYTCIGNSQWINEHYKAMNDIVTKYTWDNAFCQLEQVLKCR